MGYGQGILHDEFQRSGIVEMKKSKDERTGHKVGVDEITKGQTGSRFDYMEEMHKPEWLREKTVSRLEFWELTIVWVC